ncbi:phosphonate ABC transporter, permease protein PhnE [Frankia sp. CN6]|uniref:Phosphonate ABC transporter, permease protein PhnE n=1 Tax=Frankia nepalensis TaxID=1836974 RepID=A0A937RIR0_9ACTN|nr:phosphonate ABC transporter, permease protein PhnE [Frankia nepalensis]MBL7633003.1 phosphonate ABC transporter, permease protein PhnE [Frankia nepalensis]
MQLTLTALFGVVAVVLSVWRLDLEPAELTDAFGDLGRLLKRMWPPVFDDPGRIAELALETLLIALIGTVFAAVLSAPLALLAARNTAPNRAVQAVARGIITFCRAVPDLVFAVLFVRAMGIGVLPGIMALAVHSVGMLGKLFADAIEESSPDPREAVRSTGAGPLRELVSGVLPQVVPSWIATFIYRIDINLRTSVVLGYVGAGGIGFALKDSLSGLVYDKALGLVTAILVIIIAMELLSVVLRRVLLSPPRGDRTGRTAPRDPVKVSAPWTNERITRAVSSTLLAATFVYGFVLLKVDLRELLTSIGDIFQVGTRLIPPNFTLAGWKLFGAVVETVAIGVVATAVGFVLSIPFGLLSARTVSPNRVVYAVARTLIVVIRAIPELILAVVFVVAFGLGPLAGACALAIASIGFLGKLVADAAEEIDLGPVEAVRAVGGGWWAQLFSAVLPQLVPALIGNTLYMLDVNIRHSTILGIVGAGGVGFLLFESIRTVNYEFAGGIILIVFVIVFAVERLSGWIRSKVI